jgi:hypothetical protein
MMYAPVMLLRLPRLAARALDLVVWLVGRGLRGAGWWARGRVMTMLGEKLSPPRPRTVLLRARQWPLVGLARGLQRRAAASVWKF